MLKYVINWTVSAELFQRCAEIGNVTDDQSAIMGEGVPCQMSDGAYNDRNYDQAEPLESEPVKRLRKFDEPFLMRFW